MEIGKIAELLSPFAALSPHQLEATSIYIDILQRWNARINLTAIRDAEDIVTRHFGESYFAAKSLLTDDWTGVVIDLGSGAGFPGMPMAICRPKASVVLIESNGKKAAFLQEASARIGLKNVGVFNGRGEAFTRKGDLVVMRAVENFEKAIVVAASLVKPGGRFGLLIGDKQVEAARELLLGIRWNEPVSVPQSKSRVLLVGNL